MECEHRRTVAIREKGDGIAIGRPARCLVRVRPSGQNRKTPIVHRDLDESGLGSPDELVTNDGGRRYCLSLRAGNSIRQFGDHLLARLQPITILLLYAAPPVRITNIALHASGVGYSKIRRRWSG